MRNPWVWLVCAGGLAGRLLLAAQPSAFLLQRVIPDDAFYYLVIARNIARGLGITFDGVIPTNGFHPLWGFLLTPILRGVPDEWMAVRLALGIGAVLDVVAAMILARLVERFVRGSGIVLLITYLLHPRVALAAVSGLETPLAVLGLSLFLLAGTWAWRSGAPRDWGLMGLTAGLAVLARTDLVIVVVTVSAVLLVEHLRAGRMSLRELLTRSAALAAGGSVVIAPWVGWSLSALGTPLQSSAIAIPGLIHWLVDNQPNAWRELLWPIVNLAIHLTVYFPGASWILLACGVIAGRLSRRPGFGSTEPVHWRDAPPAPDRPVELPVFLVWSPMLGCLLAIAAHALIRWFVRPWYFVPLAAAVAVAAALVGTPLVLRGGRRLQLALLTAAILVMAIHGLRVLREQSYPGQGDLYEAALWLRSATTPGTTVGAFNAGILAYFSDRSVINLDGLTDWAAVAARREGRLMGYMVERGARWLVDWQGSIWGTFGPFLGVDAGQLSEVRRFGTGRSPYGPVLIYDVLRSGAP